MPRTSRLFVAACLFLPTFAQAQENRPDPRVAIAKTACVAGDLKAGLRLLAELYTSTNDPIWLFNQGWCYQLNDQLAQALTRFKEFLRKSGSGAAKDIKVARDYIAEIEAQLGKNDANKLPGPKAEPSSQSAIEIRVRTARKACLAGDSAKGAALLAELFVETEDFNHIYNQGRCFEQNHLYEDAISRFREFLRKAQNLTPDVRADVEKHIAECQDLGPPSAASVKPTTEAAPAAARQVASTPVFPASQAALTTPFQYTVGAAQPSTSPGRSLRIGGIAFGGIGLASVVTAIYFYTRANSLSDKVTTSDSPSAGDYQSGKNAQTMQWVFYSVGATALATGSVLYYLGWRAADSGQTAVAPMVGPGLAGLAAQGAF